MTCAAARLFSKYITRRVVVGYNPEKFTFTLLFFFFLAVISVPIFPSRVDKHRCTCTAFFYALKNQIGSKKNVLFLITMRIPLWRLVKIKIRLHTSRCLLVCIYYAGA